MEEHGPFPRVEQTMQHASEIVWFVVGAAAAVLLVAAALWLSLSVRSFGFL